MEILWASMENAAEIWIQPQAGHHYCIRHLFYFRWMDESRSQVVLCIERLQNWVRYFDKTLEGTVLYLLSSSEL
jgi:hypothetical protein